MKIKHSKHGNNYKCYYKYLNFKKWIVFICLQWNLDFVFWNLCFPWFYARLYQYHQNFHRNNAVVSWNTHLCILPNSNVFALNWSINWLFAIILSTLNWESGKRKWLLVVISYRLVFCSFKFAPAEQSCVSYWCHAPCGSAGLRTLEVTESSPAYY